MTIQQHRSTGISDLLEVSSGMLQEGKTSYLKPLEQTPYHIRLLNDLGSTYERLGEYDNAIEIYNRVLKLSPSFMETKLNKIATLYNKGDLKVQWHYVMKSGRWRKAWMTLLNSEIICTLYLQIQSTGLYEVNLIH